MINDGSARLNALMSGQVDAIHRVDPKAVALLSKAPKFEIVRAPGGWHAIMPMMIDKRPYYNPDLRIALKYAIDREAVLKAMFTGYGTLGNDHPIPRGDPYFNSDPASSANTIPTRRDSTSRRPARRPEDPAAGVGRGVQRRGRHGAAFPGERQRPASTST